MKRASSTRSSIDNPYAGTAANDVITGSGGSVEEEKKGFAHLLKNHTLDDIARLLNDDPLERGVHLGKFLRDGTRPDGVCLKNGMAEWLFVHQEPEVFLALSALGPMSVNLNNEQSARMLLEIAQSGQSISGLEIGVFSSPRHAVLWQIIPLLVEAIRISNGLDTLHIYGNDYRAHGLSPLLDALGCVRNLKFIMTCNAPGPEDFMLLADLASKNREIKYLDLGFRVQDLKQDACPFPGSMNVLLAGLKTQRGLEQLRLAGVPRACQGLLGEMIGESQALTSLHVSLYGADVTEPLITGLQRNTTLEHLTLEVDSIEDSMLPLLTLLAENKCKPARLVLETRNGRNDMADSLFIGEMIARNATISAFNWHFRHHENVDLVLLGAALQTNSTLETIVLGKTGPVPGEADISKDWIDEGQLPGLVALLEKNRTLTKWSFIDRHYPSAVRLTRPEIQEILNRNISYQQYACSDGFMEGAAWGFFDALNMPCELGQVTAPYLLQHRPRVKVGSLALVNKTTYATALDRRLRETAGVMKNVLAAGQRNDGDAAAQMLALLKRIAVMRQTFPDDALLEIAGSPFIAHGLVSLMESSPPAYDYLVTRLGEAAGSGLIYMLVMMEMRRRQEMAADPDA